MKITTVIPAYKSKYLIQLLSSLVQQTEAPDRVIFSDDSPNQDFVRMLNAEPIKSLVAHLNIAVVEGPRKGAIANWVQCFDLWGEETELVHFLCDDDYIYPTFYETHRQAHRSRHFSSSVSRRWYADEEGQPRRHALNVPEIIAKHAHKMISLDSGVLFSTTVARGANWLGEASNSVMRLEAARLIKERAYDGICFAGLEDLAAYTCGAIKTPLCFINEHLGYFRQSGEQHSADPMGKPLKLAHIAYITLALIGRNSGQMSAAQADEVIQLIGPNFLYHYRDQRDVDELREAIPALMAGRSGAEAYFLECWNRYV